MTGIAEFYQSPLGQMTHDFLQAQLRKIITALRFEERVLVIGFGLPFAADLAAMGSDKITLAYLEQMPAVPWPDAAAHQVCVVSPDALPFGDVTFDKVIIIHALEFAPDASHLLYEVQRVLTAQGQMICIAPNRNGIWSWFEHTPFGEGHTFSTRQMRRLLTQAQLAPLHIRTALYPPPLNLSFHKIALSIARGIESICGALNFRIGGVVIAVAQKQRYAGIAVHAHARARKVRLEWATPNSIREEDRNV